MEEYRRCPSLCQTTGLLRRYHSVASGRNGLRVRPAGFDRSRGQMPISALLRETRMRRRLTQHELADTLAASSGKSVTRTRISDWETGRQIPDAIWRALLCVVLGIPYGRMTAAALVSREGRRTSRSQRPSGRRRPPR